MTISINSWFVGSNSRKSALTLYLNNKKQPKSLLLFTHGFKGFKAWGHFPLICSRLSDEGYAVLAYNFSHNGGTVENPIDFPDLNAFAENTYSKELEDIKHLLEWVNKHRESYFEGIDINNISILGHSRGGGISLLAARKYKSICKVITWAAVADFENRLPSKDVLENWEEEGVYFIMNGRTKQNMPMNYSFVQDLKENAKELKIKDAVQSLEIPILLIHGEDDETVSMEEASLIQSWNSNVKLTLIKDCNHTFNGKHPWQEEDLPLATKQAVEATIKFLNN